MTGTPPFAHPPDTIRLGDLTVTRLGFGAMRLPGEGVWGDPRDPEEAKAVLRRAVDLGINLIDTAWYYGPYVSNRLIFEALHPYPKHLVIACKLGGKRRPDKSWTAAVRPEDLKSGCDEDLRTLKLERIDVVHLRWMVGTGVPFAESLGAMLELQKKGKIRHIALSNVSSAQVEEAILKTPIVCVQNLYNVMGGLGASAHMAHAEVESPEKVLELCEQRRIAYMPFFPLAMGNIAKELPALAEIAKEHEATPFQIATAWLLARSPVMLPIPGTSSVLHLEENWAARSIRLTDAQFAALRPH